MLPSSSCSSRCSTAVADRRSSSSPRTCRCRARAASQTIEMTKAIGYTLQAGGLQGRQVHASATSPATTRPPRPGKWDPAKCSANAGNYVRDKTVIGVIGTFNSGCAEIEVPILNRAGLRHDQPGEHVHRPDAQQPGAAAGEPAKYYPTGKRNYVARRRSRRLPGIGRRAAREAAEDDVGLRPERQGGVRLRHRLDVPERGQGSTASRSSASRPGIRRPRATRISRPRSRTRAPRRSSSAVSSARTAAS